MVRRDSIIPVVDAVLAYNEIDLARFRVGFLEGLVEKFFIFEARKSFSGEDKPLYFSDAIQRGVLAEANVEIVEIPLDLLEAESLSRWDREGLSREFVCEYLQRNVTEGWAVISDIDEMPSLQQLHKLTLSRPSTTVFSLPMQTVFRRCNWYLEPKWRLMAKPKAVRAGWFHHYSRNRFDAPIFAGPGLHASYLGFSEAEIRQKFLSFSHSEFEGVAVAGTLPLQMFDDLGLNHCGGFGRLGNGLLRAEPPRSFSDIQAAMASFNPAWVGAHEFKGSRPVRLTAARRVDDWIKGTTIELPAQSSEDSSFLARGTLVSAVLSVRGSALVWLVVRIRMWLFGGIVNSVVRAITQVKSRKRV